MHRYRADGLGHGMSSRSNGVVSSGRSDSDLKVLWHPNAELEVITQSDSRRDGLRKSRRTSLTDLGA